MWRNYSSSASQTPGLSKQSYGLTVVSASHLVRDSVSHNCYSTIQNVALYIIWHLFISSPVFGLWTGF
jgi:hypothetical protein